MYKKISESVFMVGGLNLSAPDDCQVYLIDLGRLVLIDSGCGEFKLIEENIASAGYSAGDLDALILTHCHVDHIGGAAAAQRASGCKIAAHALDAEAIETGDPVRTASSWYGVKLPKLKVDLLLTGGVRLEFEDGELEVVHIPGHTPGSIALLLCQNGQKILFGQDLHGPFHADFGSDINAWAKSMERLLALEADVLCEGHYGIYKPAHRVRAYIERQLEDNGF